MCKLHNYGIRGLAFSWIQSYLSNRFMCTVVNNAVSDFCHIKCGVPQGSVLGPLFFLIYINDISRACDDAKIKLYADDANAFLVDKNVSQLYFRANSVLNKINYWCLCNKLTVNVTKTNYMLFNSTPNSELIIVNDKLKIEIGGSAVDRVYSTK